MAEATSVLRRFDVAHWLYSTHWHTAGELGHGDILGSRKQPNKYFRIMDVRSTLDNWTYSDRKAQQTRPLHKKPNLHWNGMEDPKDGGERSVIAFESMPWNSIYIPPLFFIWTGPSTINMNKHQNEQNKSAE